MTAAVRLNSKKARGFHTRPSRGGESFFRYLIRNDLLEPALNKFLANGDRYNLLNSAFLELIEFIRRESIWQLITHFVEKYWERVKDIHYVTTFQLLKEKYDSRQVRTSSCGFAPTVSVTCTR